MVERGLLIYCRSKFYFLLYFVVFLEKKSVAVKIRKSQVELRYAIVHLLDKILSEFGFLAICYSIRHSV